MPALGRSVLVIVLGLLHFAPALVAQERGPASPPEVVLQPGDMVEILVWREEDLSGEFLIDETGSVTVPLLGRIQAAGTPVGKFRDRLLEIYARELRNPSVVITPMRRVYVLGEVTEPGLYQVDPTMTLAGAIAMAGGASPQGDLRRLRIVRGGQVIRKGAEARYSLATIDVRSGDQIFVERRGWLDRNSTFIVSAMISVTSIVISLLR